MTMWLCIILLGSSAHGAEGPATPTPEEAIQSNAMLLLQEAKEAYFAGDLEIATAKLEALRLQMLQGANLGEAVTVDTLIYLGEIRYLAGDTSVARQIFRSCLLDYPNALISPYEHPIDVVGLFEMVRREVVASITPPPPKGGPPLWAYLPFGVPQAKQGRPVAAIVSGSVQGAMAIGSISTHIYLSRINRIKNPSPVKAPALFDEHKRRAQTMRYTAQFPMTVGFYTLWFMSHLDARKHYKTTRTVILPQSERPGFVFTGRF